MTADDDDDRQIGRILGRREMLALIGGAGVVLLAECAPVTSSAGTIAPSAAVGGPATASPSAPAQATTLPSCIVRPALTEGPYFVDEKLNRSDIRSDPSNGSVRPGVLLALTFAVARVSGGSCAALGGATIDVWHCDALGVYSDAADAGFNTKGQRFLRGYQTTDAAGRASFATIYPGWYQGRAVHIHFKIRVAAASGPSSEFTSQLFFDESINDQVFALAPYSQKSGTRLRNSGDGIYRDGGEKLLVAPAKTAAGYSVTFDIGIA